MSLSKLLPVNQFNHSFSGYSVLSTVKTNGRSPPFYVSTVCCSFGSHNVEFEGNLVEFVYSTKQEGGAGISEQSFVVQCQKEAAGDRNVRSKEHFFPALNC